MRTCILLSLATAVSPVALSLSAAAAILKVPVGAPRAAVRSAYRQMAALSHPDVVQGHAAEFLRVQEAYELCIRYCQPAPSTTVPRSAASTGARSAATRHQPSHMDVAPGLVEAWREYWRSAMAAERASKTVGAQADVCRFLASELRSARQRTPGSRSDELRLLEARLDEANRVLRERVRLFGELHAHAEALQNRAMEQNQGMGI